MREHFDVAYESMILAEGGYKLYTVPGDTGGMTYAGIARNPNPQWEGWRFIDANQIPPTELVRKFYLDGWWVPMRLDDIVDPAAAISLFKFAMNSSAYGRPLVAIKVAQLAAKVTPDGFIGPVTVDAINAMLPELFLARLTIAQVARYTEICNKDRTRVQAKTFLLGWNNRALKGFAL